MAQCASHRRSAWTDTGLAAVAGVFGVFLSMRMGLLGFASDHDMIFYGIPLEIGATMARGVTGLPELKDIQFIPVVHEPDYLEHFRDVLAAAKVDRVIFDTAVLSSIFPEGDKTPGICGLLVRKLATVLTRCPRVFAPGQPLARHLYLSHR